MIDIFIPVKNRFSTLKYTLKTCLAFVGSDSRLKHSKIIILDCDSSDIPQAWLNSLPSSVVYAATSDNLSMSANWERSFDYMSNPYFTFVGSDDGLIYNKSSVDKIFAKPEVDCFFWQKISFFWPDTIFAGSPSFANFPVPLLRRQVDDILTNILELKAPWNSLPCVYNSIVSCKFAKKIKDHISDNIFFGIHYQTFVQESIS